MRDHFFFRLFVFVLTTSFCTAPLFAQSECAPPQVIFNKNAANIFNDRQDMDLGDAMAERSARDYRVIDDAEINAYLQKIGDRLIRHLPPSGIKFQFVVVDLPELNAFALAGGRIYVSRKMISFARNEDELAGVMAHELGHGTVRHSAIDMTKLFKEILNVTSVGDRRDVFEKYNQYIEKRRTKSVRTSANHEDDQQLEADRIGMHAMIAAGYDPEIYLKFWSRFTDAKKRGFFSELAGLSKPADVRLREMINAKRSLPPQCLEKRPATASEDFDKWKTAVINFSGFGGKESLSGLIYRRKLTALRSDIEHFRFSPDGQFILAQDNSGVTVLRREPFSILFRIDAGYAMPANFTPDSKMVVVYNKNLRVQKWNIAEKRAVSTHELYSKRGYWQSAISPDGNFMACYEYDGDLVVYDVATNESVFTKTKFYLPNYWEHYIWQIYLNSSDENEVKVFNMKFSPDNSYFLAGRRVFGGSETIGINLQTKKAFDLNDNIKKLLLSTFTFIAPDRVVGQYGKEIAKSGVFAFPSGERIEQFELSGTDFSKSERGDYLMVRPVNGAAVGVYDLKAKKYVLANRKSALDVYDNFLISELKNGELALYSLGKKEAVQTLNLPASPLGDLRTVTLSPDGGWLSVSEKSRGAVWNLANGERVLHVRGFRGSYFAPDKQIYADFPKQGENERTIARMNATTGEIAPVAPIAEKVAEQHEQFVIAMKSTKPEKDSKADKKREERTAAARQSEDYQERIAAEDVEMTVSDAQTGNLLWSRIFVDERPRYAVHPAQNTMAFVWNLGSKAAKNIIKEDPMLKAKLSAMREKEGDYLIQIVEPKTGKVTGQVLIETGEGSFEVENVMAAGDWLVFADDKNRFLLYSISGGEIRHRFFGTNAEINRSGNLLAIGNTAGRVTIYDTATGNERGRLSFNSPIAALKFTDDDKQMFVLTDNQTAYMFDPEKFGAETAVSTK